jgi:release factor glutamine methyltransferase
MNELNTLLKAAQQRLSLELSIDADEASLDVRLLVQQVLNVNHAWLISHAHDALLADQINAFNALFERRLAGEPMAYVLGQREFYGLALKTTSSTLIPRPDTETLVEAALARISTDNVVSVLDLGTGTGAIALAIASQRPQAKITAVDFSAAALKVAVENSQSLKLNLVQFIESSWFSAFTGDANKTFDVIVSNPPYISENDVHLSQGDLRFEPISALASGVDGLDDIRIIIKQAPQHLNQGGWLMLEHGYDQATAVAQLLADAGFTQISHALDLAGIQRVTLGCWQPSS